MRKKRYKRKYKSFNQKLGSSLYIIVFSIIMYVSFKIWGMEIFNGVYFILFSIISYISVKVILIAVGIWKY